jgi:putative transposase
MTRLEDRQILVRDIEQACADGSRLAPACALGGIDARTLRRWQAGDGLIQGDRRPDAERPVPSHALTEARGPRSSRRPTNRASPRRRKRGLSEH